MLTIQGRKLRIMALVATFVTLPMMASNVFLLWCIGMIDRIVVSSGAAPSGVLRLILQLYHSGLLVVLFVLAHVVAVSLTWALARLYGMGVYVWSIVAYSAFSVAVWLAVLVPFIYLLISI